MKSDHVIVHTVSCDSFHIMYIPGASAEEFTDGPQPPAGDGRRIALGSEAASSQVRGHHFSHWRKPPGTGRQGT